jgi:hypothetical protein
MNNLTDDPSPHVFYFPEQRRFLLYTSLCSFVSCMYAFHRNNHVLSICGCMVGCSSLNYWRYPMKNGWNRYLDIVNVLCWYTYILYKIYYHEQCLRLYILSGITIIFYPAGIVLYNKRLYWLSAYAHGSLHIFANIIVALLVSSELRQLTADSSSIQ